ncbi:hypothetical protein MTO96_023043 [Rhipicephalus appendiculatus]
MSRYFLPFRHEVVPEKYLIMWDFSFFDKIHRGFTFSEEEAHKYVFSQEGALTGALNYYRAFNNDSDQLKKFNYLKINVSTLILWGEQDAFLTTPIARYNQVYLRNSQVVYYPGAVVCDVHVPEGFELPGSVCDALGLGPKFAQATKRTKPELRSVVREAR